MLSTSPEFKANAARALEDPSLQKALTRNLPVEDRGVRRARWAVLRDATMPAVLIEAGFLTHPTEGRLIHSTAYRQKIARAIVEGLLAYKRAVEQGT